MNKSPRQLFLENKPRVEAHLAVVDNAGFVMTANDALTQMTIDMPSSSDPQKAMKAAWMVEGAKLYRDILLNFADQTARPKTPNPTQLEPT